MDEDHKPLFLVIQTSLLSICWSPQSQLQSPVPPIYRRRYHLKFDIELYINTSVLERKNPRKIFEYNVLVFSASEQNA